MKQLIKTLIVVFSIAFVGCSSQEKNTVPVPKYVFLFIGDGMGFQQVNATQAYLAALDSTTGNTHLSFTSFPATGFVTTFAGTRYITCSAAAGTAIASGKKTSIGTIGLNADHTDSLFSIAHHANRVGYKVGVVTSVSIDHATPAAFYAHQPNRDMYHEIGHDLINSGFRFFASGGFRDPMGKKSENPRGNFIEMGANNGVLFTSSLSLSEDDLANHQTIVYTAPNAAGSSTLQYKIDAKPSEVTLAQLTQMGIDVVFNPKGFFMMVEGGKIDWACHDNDAATVIHETLAFSDAISVAYEFYKKHPTETLIVVTSDHETGGMSLGVREHGYESNIALLAKQNVSKEKFDTKLKELAKQHGDKPKFKDVMELIQQGFGLGAPGLDLTKQEVQLLKKSFYNQFYGNTKPKAINEDYNSELTVTMQAIAILNNKAGIGWTSYSHTGSQVPLYAIGAGQELFVGQLDNTQLAPLIAKLMGFAF